MLLESLYSRPVRLTNCQHASSLSLILLDDSIPEGPQAPRKAPTVRRSTSEKVLKRTISNLSESSVDINLQILEEEYL